MMLVRRGCALAPPATCRTVSGPDPGRPCMFPFIFEGEVHTGCVGAIYDDVNITWCDTRVDATLTTGWGVCNDNVMFGGPDQCFSGVFNRPIEECKEELGLKGSLQNKVNNGKKRK